MAKKPLPKQQNYLEISCFQVHQSLGDIFGDLQSKDLQLTLAMQDLSIATEEIKKAAEFRSRLESLERYACVCYILSSHIACPYNIIIVVFV